MAELKTKKTTASVSAFIANIPDVQKREDAKALVTIFKDATGEKPAMWGDSIIGFGSYHYESKRSTQKGDWPLTGFSPRKANISLYIMPGFSKYGALLKKIGTHKVSKGSCLYIKRLSDIDQKVLKTLVERSIKDMKKMYTK